MLVRYFAAARAAAGTDSETVPLDGPAAPTRREVECLLAARHPQPPSGQPPLAQVLARSSFLLDGVACPDPRTPIGPDAVLDVLPPFSGG
ncbi:MoaD/ThiS family protein [Kocuria sp. M1R5S2]|uniref:MoaD/ThiS family protein n=1 Tax=Kocuria rhizosphaerae TaxID=3376285 RepID=UPI0037AD0AAD